MCACHHVRSAAPETHVVVLNHTQEILDVLRELREGSRVSTFAKTINLAQLKAAKPDVIIQDLLVEGMQVKGSTFLTRTALTRTWRRSR